MGEITNISYPEVQNLVEDLQSQIDKLNQQVGGTAGSGNPSDLTPSGVWPIATRPGKNGRVIVTLRCAVPSTTTKLKVVLEEFTGTGAGVTVTWRINSADIEIPSPTPAIFDFDFPIALYAGKKYGCIKLVSVAADGSRTQNPAVDFPDSPRNESDYFVNTVFTLGPLFGAPSDPNCTLIGAGGGIVANALDPNTDFSANVTFRVWAPLDATGAAQSWGASNVDTVVIVAKSGSFVPKHIVHVLNGTELTQTDPTSIGGVTNRGYVDITQIGYIPGDQITWAANISWIGNDKSVSTGAPCTISAGGFQVDPANLTGLSLSIDTTTPPYTSKAGKVTLNFTQPATPVALKNVKVFRKLTSEGSGSYVLFIDKTTLKHKELDVTGAQSIVIADGARFHPNKNYDLQVVIAGIGNAQVTFTRTNFAPGDPTDVPVDTQVPGGTGVTLTAPVCSFEDGKLAIDFDVTGLSFMNTHLYNSVRLATLSETVPTFTITNAPLTTSPTTITTSVPHGYSVGQTVVISGVVGNTAVNGTWVILTVPSTTTFRIGVAGNFAYTSGGTVTLPGAFLDIPSKALVVSEITSKYQVHKSGHVVLGFKLRKIRDIFGPATHIAVRYFITNSIGESQSAIANVDLAALTDLMSETGLESGAGIPAKTLAINTVNVCPGGGFFASKDAYDALGATTIVGKEWRDRPNRSVGTRIDTVGTSGLKWVPATHWIEIATNVFTAGGELCCFIPIRPYLPGDSWALGFLLKTASGTYTLNAFTMSLYDEGNAADIPGTPVTINATDAKPIILTTVYQTIGAVFSVGSGYVPGTVPRRQWLRLKFGENPSVVLNADNVMNNRGAQILPWGPALEDAGVPADVNPSGDTGSGAAGSTGGGGNGSGGGASGGGVGAGSAGGIEL